MWSVRMKHVPPNAEMGRFGGGWQWKLGFQASEGFRTVILNLLVFSIIVDRKVDPNKERMR